MSDVISIGSPVARSSRSASSKATCNFERIIPEMATPEMADALPRLSDDADIGVEKVHVVIKDGDADLRFSGVLVASAAPNSAGSNGRWKELRVYRTKGGSLVFSEIGRSLVDGERDKFSAEVFEFRISAVLPTMEGGQVVSYQDKEAEAAVRFFGYTPLAKALYTKLGMSTERKIV